MYSCTNIYEFLVLLFGNFLYKLNYPYQSQLSSTKLNYPQTNSNILNQTQLSSTKLNYPQPNSTHLNQTQLPSTKLNHSQPNSTILCQTHPLFNQTHPP